jgi:hypothetical protein
MIAPNVLGFNLNTGIFFIVAGIVQLFWVVPTVRRWGLPWYYVGIGGTVLLIILFAITRMPNPITGMALPVQPMGIAVESLEAAFIGLSAAVIAGESRLKEIGVKADRKTDTEAA